MRSNRVRRGSSNSKRAFTIISYTRCSGLINGFLGILGSIDELPASSGFLDWFTRAMGRTSVSVCRFEQQSTSFPLFFSVRRH